MLDIQNFIGESSTEADRIRKYRNKIKEDKEGVQMLRQMYNKSTPEIELEKEKELKLKKELEKKTEKEEKRNKIIDLYNSYCTNLPKVQKLTDKRKKQIDNFLKEFNQEQIEDIFCIANQSSFLIRRK